MPAVTVRAPTQRSLNLRKNQKSRACLRFRKDRTRRRMSIFHAKEKRLLSLRGGRTGLVLLTMGAAGRGVRVDAVAEV